MLEYLSNTCRVSSSGRATASQAVGGGFESRILLQDLLPYIPYGRPKGRSCGAFCFYRPPGGVFFVLASLYFYLDLYPPSTLLSESPLPLRGIPPSGGAGLWFLPHPEGAAPGLEPRQGRGRRPGGSSKGGGLRSRALPAAETARRSRGSGLLFASGRRPAQQKQGTATRRV